MAAEQDLKLDGGNAEAEAASGGGKKKLIIIILIALIVLAGAGGAAFFFLTGDDNAAADTAAEVVAEPELPAQYVILKPEFVISFQVGPRQRFLQVNIEVMTRRQSVIDVLNMNEPMVRNDIIRIIGEQNFDHLRTPEGKVELQQLLTRHLSELVKREGGEDDVEAVLFTDFVMQ